MLHRSLCIGTFSHEIRCIVDLSCLPVHSDRASPMLMTIPSGTTGTSCHLLLGSRTSKPGDSVKRRVRLPQSVCSEKRGMAPSGVWVIFGYRMNFRVFPGSTCLCEAAKKSLGSPMFTAKHDIISRLRLLHWALNASFSSSFAESHQKWMLSLFAS